MAHVMIIDDDPLVSRFLEEHLLAEGHEPQSFALAEQGFQTAVLSPPDLILLDVMLPDATGFQMVNRFRKHPKTSHVPIIMMSGTARHQNQKEIAKDLGANEYMEKPIDSELMSAKIDQLLRLRPKPVAVDPMPNAPAHSPEPLPVWAPPATSLAATPPPVPPPEVPYPEIAAEIPTAEFQTPEIQAPEVQAPEIQTPEVQTPEFLAPETSVPEAPVSKETAPENPTPVLPETSSNGDNQDINLPEVGYEGTASSLAPVEPIAEVEPVAAEEPGPQQMTISIKTRWALAVLGAHVVLAAILAGMGQASAGEVFRTASGVVAGWMLLLGLLVGACAAMKIALRADEALGLLLWPAVPILARVMATMAGLKLESRFVTPELYWVRPLDIFELAAILILGVSLRRKPGSSLGKAVSISLLLAFTWCLTNRGYFQP